MLGRGSELPILEGVQTGCERMLGVERVPGMNWPMFPSLVLGLDPGTPYRASRGVIHQRPPSCREGQRLARTAPSIRGHSQTLGPVSPSRELRPCLASSAARPAPWRLSFSWWGRGPCSFLAWIPPLGGQANASQRPLSPAGRPGTKAALRLDALGAVSPGAWPHRCASYLASCQEPVPWVQDCPSGAVWQSHVPGRCG